MKRITKLLYLFFIVLILQSCTMVERNDVVVSIFPYYDLVKQITKEEVSIKMLTPVGSDIHNFEPTSKDLINLTESKVFIHTSDDVDPWVKNINFNNTKILSLNSFDGWHKWTDPLSIIYLIDEILPLLIDIKPNKKEFFTNNANLYKSELLIIDDTFKTLLNGKTIFFAGHESHDSLAIRYNLNIISLEEEIEPDIEITAKQWINLIEEIREHDVNYLFFEELIDPVVAVKIQKYFKKEDRDLKLLLLHGIHNVSIEEWKQNISYLDLLKINQRNLMEALQND